MLLSPLARYQEDLKQTGFQRDASQEDAVRHLQGLYDCLLESSRQRSGWMDAFPIKLFRPHKKTVIKGLYFWGGVGRGKTYLMDVFYDALPFEQKLRTHFHRFMRRVHARVNVVGWAAGPFGCCRK